MATKSQSKSTATSKPSSKRPGAAKSSPPPKRHKRAIYQVIIFVALLAVAADVAIIAYSHQINQENQAFAASQVSVLGNNKVPSSVKPSTKAVDNYQVAPNLPKYLIIRALGINARIVALSTNAQDQIEAPGNVYDTGWYSSSSLPGQPGAMFIDGHVTSWTANGVFFNLDKLKPGDTIQVQRGDNTMFTFVVKELQSYNVNTINMTQVLSPLEPEVPGSI